MNIENSSIALKEQIELLNDIQRQRWLLERINNNDIPLGITLNTSGMILSDEEKTELRAFTAHMVIDRERKLVNKALEAGMVVGKD